MGREQETYNVYRQLCGRLLYVGIVEADGAFRAIEVAKQVYGIPAPIVELNRND